MNGLKANITFTLAATITAGMLMLNLVMITFWQQSLLRQQVEHTRTILRSIAESYPKSKLTGGLQTALENAEIKCGIILQEDTIRRFFSQPTCETSLLPLESLVRKASLTNKPAIDFHDTSWSGISFQKRFLLVAVPMPGGHQTTKALGAAIPLKPLWLSIRSHQKIVLAYILVNILLLTTIGFFRLARSIIRPIEKLVQITSSYDNPSDMPLLPDTESSEFRQLSSALHGMVAHIEQDRQKLRETVHSLEQSNRQLQETHQEMVRTEKLASIGRLSAGLAHEIGNPIGIIQGYLELLQKDSLSDDDRLQYSTRAVAELNRINLLIRQLLDFSRSAPPGKQKIDINDLVLDIVDMLGNQKKMENIRFETRLDAKQSVIEANEEGVRQVLLNILLNSVDAIKEKKGSEPFLTFAGRSKRALTPFFVGIISITTKNSMENEDRRDLIITIKDNGCGIAPDNLDNIFDPFFTTKEPGKGTGLGLSVSHSIIEAAGGKIEAASTPNIGSEIKIILPVPEEGR